MLERIIDLPDNVLGFKASGTVTAKDYTAVLVPGIEAKLKSMKRVRLLFVLGSEFKGYTGGAAWEDAKVGLRHLTHFERAAVVTDVESIRRAVRAFGFAMPCEVRLFGNDDLQDAREWISEPPAAGTLEFDFLAEQGVLVLRPRGELVATDFERVSREIDTHIATKGGLTGVMIVAAHFPGWDDLGALGAHLRFVKEHRKKIRRLALVTDDRLMSVVPAIAGHFIVPEARHFPMSREDDALAWVCQG